MTNPNSFYPSSNIPYNVVSSADALLGGIPSSVNLSMFTTDDGSGRQKWYFIPHYGSLASTTPEYLDICVAGGGTSGTYLSCTSNGQVVDLNSGDDSSGRQQWVLVPVSTGENRFAVQVRSGVTLSGQSAPYYLVNSGTSLILQSGLEASQIWSFRNCPRYF